VVDAQKRKDAYAYAALAGSACGFQRHLMRDDPAAAQAELAEAMAPWPVEPFSTNHYGELQGITFSSCYQGGDGAFRWFERNRARLSGASILRSPTFKLAVAHLRATALLAAMTGRRGDRTAMLMGGVEADVRILRRFPSPLSIPMAYQLSSVLAALLGDHERALREAQCAQRAYSSLSHAGRRPTLYWEGWLEGGEAGRAKCEEALATIRAQGWADPLRSVRMIFPILHFLPRV
jgi:hypothetical protein